MQNIEEIYKKYAKIVYKYVFCLTGNKDVTEEIVQETFLVAVKDINKFRGDCKISSWLCQISKYIWYKRLKKEKRLNEVPFDDLKKAIEFEETLDEKLYKKEMHFKILKQVQKLDKDTKDVMYLRLLGNLKFKEIAQIMGKSVDWAKVTFFRGKKKIKEGLKDEK